VFGFISPYLDRHPADDYVKSILTTALFERSVDYARGHDPELNDQQFRTVAVQLKALGLVTIDYLQTVGGGMGLFWSITNTGERLMIEVRTVRKGTPGNQG
jgi:hypothetical protein